MDLQLQTYLKLALRGNEWLVSISSCFLSGSVVGSQSWSECCRNLKIPSPVRQSFPDASSFQHAAKLTMMHTQLSCLQYKCVYINDTSIILTILTFLNHWNSLLSRTNFTDRYLPILSLEIGNKSITCISSALNKIQLAKLRDKVKEPSNSKHWLHCAVWGRYKVLIFLG